MLRTILPEITRFCRIISTVTGVDIEIVDAGFTRVAGTGIYAEDLGRSIRQAGEIYRHALSTGTTVYIDNPREHALCQNCLTRDDCRELLTLCTPITLGTATLGIIGLICFTLEDRERVLAQKEVFVEFVQQIAVVISNVASNEQRSRKVSQMMDLLLQVTDRNTHGIVMFGKTGRISYANETARQEFSLDEGILGEAAQIRETGNTVADMKEYELCIGVKVYHPFGRLIPLESADDDFAHVLLTDTLPRMTEVFSLFGGGAESAGGLSDIIGEGRAITGLKGRVRQIARTSSTVLITGESGTGKEMFARAIHAESERKNKPFIAINCGAIPDSLLESELFGYVSGAFTGANHSGRVGKVELADGGVLFLDEISSMSLHLQVKLLRFLQERRFTRLGSNREIAVDVRIIAASNDHLPTLIEQRVFRDDLYYRLNVIPLDLPPLRRRLEDLPRLAEFFLDRYCARFGKPAICLTPAMLAMLKAYPWPGNVREFENCIEYLVAMHDGGRLTPALLPAKIHDAYVAGTGATLPATPAAPRSITPHLPGPSATVRPLAEVEMDAISNALALFGDTTDGKKRAAEALGIGLATLYRKLRL